MGRVVTTNMTNILAGGKRDLDWTLDIVFPDATAFYFATSPIASLNGHTYTNDLEDVSQLRITLEAPIDVVNIGIQNRDRVLGQHLATYWQKWRTAKALLGRQYYQVNDSGVRTGTTDWSKMFPSAVQRPNADDFQVTFDLIPDTTAPGQIVCTRTCGPNCPFLFKHAKTCGYSGLLTTCNHQLKSTGGCDGRENSHNYGGCEHRYLPDVSVPGTGGNPGGGGGGHDCPRIDQYVRVRGENDIRVAKMAGFVTEEDWLWHPILRRFFKVRSVEIIRDQPIWQIVAANGAAGFSSFSHPVIRNVRDGRGTAVSSVMRGLPILTEIEQMEQSFVTLSADTGETGSVVRIEMETDVQSEKIYCYGDSVEKMIDCHNSKPIDF